MDDTYWVVNLRAFAFETEAEAESFADALSDAFMEMPEAIEIASFIRWFEEKAE